MEWARMPIERSTMALSELRLSIEAVAVRVAQALPEPANQIMSQNPLLAAAVALLLVTLVLAALWPAKTKGPKMGNGSNSSWNRRIRMDRPSFVKKHHKLQHKWTFEGPGTEPDLDIVKNNPLCTASATDPATGFPLSGHLVGRATWKAHPADKAGAAEQASLSFDPSINCNAGDKILRAQLLAQNGGDPADAEPSAPRGIPCVSPYESMKAGWDFFFKLQAPEGHWAGDYGGPHFLLPGMIIVCHLTGFDLGLRKQAMLTYMYNHQQTDGGWGLHIEGPSTLFGTIMNYVACRLLGMAADDEIAAAARRFISANGGAVMAPHWCKFWLATLGCFEYAGVNPIPPELWILPSWFPFHPSKMWCHSRLPYLGISYVYGRGFVGPQTPIIACLRQELFNTPYDSIDWDSHRNTVADIDLYAPHTWILDVALGGFRLFETYAPRWLFNRIRQAGIDWTIGYIHAEDMHTNYIDIGPVNKVFNMLACWVEGGSDSEAFKRHCARLDDYLWVAEDGMKMQGYNGSQLWDTAFAMQALGASGIGGLYDDQVAKCYAYADATQIKEDVPLRQQYFRTISKGGWPFSTNDHGWPIADCTAEGLKLVFAVRGMALSGQVNLGGVTGQTAAPAAASSSSSLSSSVSLFADGYGGYRTGHLSPARLFDAINVILAFHNPDGGWATYEEMRGAEWYEYANPIEAFGDMMIDYTYTELTSSCVQALTQFQRIHPEHRPQEVSRAIAAGVQYIREQQREDGSWYGSWAVCFTYGCWFGVKALVQGGEPNGRDKAALDKCCSFLLSKQQADGGWGESYLSCLTKEYSHIDSTVVNTSWALLSLIHAQCTDAAAIRRGIDFLVSKQCRSGDWAQEWCSGIFNRTCGITYTSYRNVFPLWALAAYCNEYRHKEAGAGSVATAQRSPATEFGGAAIALHSSSTAAAAASSSSVAGPAAARRGRSSASIASASSLASVSLASIAAAGSGAGAMPLPAAPAAPAGSRARRGGARAASAVAEEQEERKPAGGRKRN